MVIVYIDVLYIINSAATYILLDITARLSGAYLRRANHIGASLLSGLMAVIAFFAPSGVVISMLTRIFICLTIVCAAFKPGRHGLLRLGGIFFIVSLCMGGIVMLLALMGLECAAMSGGLIYFNMTYTRLFMGFFIGYVIFTAVLGRRGMTKQGEIVTVEAFFGSTPMKFTAMVDTGNLLTEPTSGKAVILISPELARGIAFDGRCYPIPATTAAGFQLMSAYAPDRLSINGTRRDDFIIGIAGSPIRGLQGTRGIIGGQIWDF